MCSHNEVNIAPTIETVWGLDDCYNITCGICKKVLYEEIPCEELNIIIKNNKYNILTGQKYIY